MDAQALVKWNLRKLRVLRGLSQEALAVDAEIDRTYVSRLERGLENPTIAVLARIAKALEVDIREFFELPAEGAPPPQPLRKGRKPPQ
ncbi:putative HTH-type transcriptional regulator [Magnetospirillum gryphiswaldense MSR-1 v2]|uniref:HTH-type transcriptional regulator n=1 Tax=Magnetospirillum gryphiswaldense (strain DSM 6361 / JCM 21280 / NBRC 15271 / MSR-1) TaxID=431944 RepID=V6EZR1_MAGGM|nr:helix-turn-helix transcriptional regulator [Magnetospirillum gryphiswaldense]CDK97536.1 putative HTH-type transcriptional regulator [Magnetospirillum gryphiswaldense MSR-1 v2]